MSEAVPGSERIRSAAFAAKEEWHRAAVRLPLREKFRILLLSQRQELPLLAARRPLASWEQPWRIEP